MARILVTEEIAEAGLDRLRAAGHEVDFRPGLNGSDLVAREGIVSVHGIDLV